MEHEPSAVKTHFLGRVRLQLLRRPYVPSSGFSLKRKLHRSNKFTKPQPTLQKPWVRSLNSLL